METPYLVLNTFAMPLPGLPFPRAPYRYGNRGHIIAYHSSRAELVS
jgi:acetoacetate decarboxylase